MRGGQLSTELGPPSTSAHVALTPVFGGGTARRSRYRPSSRTTKLDVNARMPSFRGRNRAMSSETATAAPEMEEASTVSPEQPGLTGRLQSWLPWSQSIPLASKLDAAASADDDQRNAALMGDGMASSVPAPVPTTRRGWYAMSRRRGATADPSLASQTVERPVAVDHATLQVLRQRVLSKSQPGARLDSFKLGLVVEGGGMRGCVSGGALQALADLGMRDAFDAVYGSSAGAINGTYFISGQRDGVHIYHDHIASQEFIDLRRLISRKPGTAPALNLNFLLDTVIHDVHPLDFDAVLSSSIPLKVVASSLDTLSPILLQDFEDKADLVECLRASANVPEVAGGPVKHRGHRMVDAAVFEAVPFRSAIADGCTHVLVLCTRPAPERKSYLDQALSDAVEAVVKRAVMSPEYMVPAWRAEVECLVKDGMSQDEMLLRAFDDDAHQLPWFAGTHVYPVYPSAAGTTPSPLCIDVPTLKAGVAEGRRSIMAIARAALGDVVDVSRFEEAANIVPLPRRSAVGRSASSRLWKRYMGDADFSHHA